MAYLAISLSEAAGQKFVPNVKLVVSPGFLGPDSPKGPLYRLRPRFCSFLAKKGQKWQKTALAGMAHPPKRGKRAQKRGAFGPFRPKEVATLVIWHEFLTSGLLVLDQFSLAKDLKLVGSLTACLARIAP